MSARELATQQSAARWNFIREMFVITIRTFRRNKRSFDCPDLARHTQRDGSCGLEFSLATRFRPVRLNIPETSVVRLRARQLVGGKSAPKEIVNVCGIIIGAIGPTFRRILDFFSLREKGRIEGAETSYLLLVSLSQGKTRKSKFGTMANFKGEFLENLEFRNFNYYQSNNKLWGKVMVNFKVNNFLKFTTLEFPNFKFLEKITLLS